jgi:hypothetical protein
MILKIIQNDFIDAPSLTQCPPEIAVLDSSMKFFDKDGYELNHTEQLYHEFNDVNLSEKHLYHTANHTAWFVDTEDSVSGFVLDHSMTMQRWDYQGRARKQIERLIPKKPTLGKLLSIRQKWGIDFSLDYVDPTGWSTEVFHIENDFLDIRQAIEAKKRAEDIIMTANWANLLDEMLERKSEWRCLCSDDQADWKARLVGWHRAFDNQKVFI